MPSSGPETKVAMPAVVFTILRPVDDVILTVHIRVSFFPDIKILPMFSIFPRPFPYRVHFNNSTNVVAIHIIINLYNSSGHAATSAIILNPCMVI